MPKVSLGESFTVALISGIEKVWIRVWEYQDFLSIFFCLTVPKKFRGGILHSCINSRYRQSLDRRRGGVSKFPSKFICLTVPKFSVGESFSVALISGI